MRLRFRGISERRLAQVRGQIGPCRMFPQHHQRPAQVASACQAIDPGDRIGRVLRILEDLHDLGKIGGGPCGLVNPGRFHGTQPDRRAGDDPRQPHPAQSMVEKERVFRRAASCQRTVGIHDLDPVDTGAEAAVLVVVLAMHIRGNGPPERHEFRTGRDQGEPAARQKGGNDVAQKNAGLGDQLTARGVECQHVIKVARLKGRGAIDGAVAIGASVAAGDKLRLLRHQTLKFGHVARPVKTGVQNRVTAPT